MAGRTGTEPRRVLDLAALDLGVQSGHALVVERNFAAHEDVQDDAERPHVDLGASVRLGVEELGRGKVERAAERRQVRHGRVQVRQAKVDDLDVARLRDEDVLDLEVCAAQLASVMAQ